MKQLLTLVLFICLFACEDNLLPSRPENANLVFPLSQPLEIVSADLATGFLPTFNLQNPSSAFLYIAIFREQITTVDNRITNEDAVVWEWHSGLSKKNKITPEDGVLKDPNLTSAELICQDGATLYWAAWAWDEQGIYIAYSTPLNPFTLQARSLPDLHLQLIIEEDANQDGYYTKGENLNARLVVENTGGTTAADIEILISNSDIIDFPRNFQLGTLTLEPGEIHNIPLTFRLPPEAEYKEVVPIEMKADYNDCLESSFNQNITITGAAVCLHTATLLEIKDAAYPQDGFWDFPFGIAPDPFFVVFESGNILLYRSDHIEDINPNISPAQWAPLSPCLPLQLNKFYSLDVYDEDNLLISNDDFIGNISFRPDALLEERPTEKIFENDRIKMKVEFIWE